MHAANRHEDGILWDMVEEHLDEAEFLWLLWERGLDSPCLTVSELASGTEARLFAHMEGLVLAAPAVIERLLLPALRDHQRDRAAAASWAWLSTGDSRALPTLCGPILRDCAPPERRGVVRALGLWDGGDFRSLLEPALSCSNGALQAAALTIMVAHGWSPGPIIAELAESRDNEVVMACVELAVPAAMTAALTGELEERGFELALRAGLMRRMPRVWTAALARLERRGAAAAVGALGGEREVSALMAALGDPRRRASALFGLGFTGRRTAADACAAWIDDSVCGALAADAFAAITGFELEPARVERARAEEEVEEEEIPEEDVDAGLVWVDPGTLREWWKAERRRFDPGRRYLFGAPATGASMADAFERTTMRRRRWLALELAVRTQGRVDVDTRTWTERQRRALRDLRYLRVELEPAMWTGQSA